MASDTAKGDPGQGVGVGLLYSELGELLNLSCGKKLDAYGEAGCFSAS